MEAIQADAIKKY